MRQAVATAVLALGLGTVAPADILIGQTAGFSGPVAAGVQETTDGAKLWIDAVNARGGVLGGRKLELVTADGEVELLEITAAVLQDVAAHHPHVADSQRRFYRQRLLANAMVVSPLFRMFGKAERRAVMEKFRP